MDIQNAPNELDQTLNQVQIVSGCTMKYCRSGKLLVSRKFVVLQEVHSSLDANPLVCGIGHLSLVLETTFLVLQTDDGGQYRCTARNERGEVSLSMNLDVTAEVSIGKLGTKPQKPPPSNYAV